MVKMGRPTDNPKNLLLHIRIDEASIKMLEYCAEKKKLSRAEVVRHGIRKVYEDIKK